MHQIKKVPQGVLPFPAGPHIILLYHFFFFGSDNIITPAMIPTNPARSIPEKATCMKITDIAVAVNGSTDASRLALDPPISRTPSI